MSIVSSAANPATPAGTTATGTSGRETRGSVCQSPASAYQLFSPVDSTFRAISRATASPEADGGQTPLFKRLASVVARSLPFTTLQPSGWSSEEVEEDEGEEDEGEGTSVTSAQAGEGVEVSMTLLLKRQETVATVIGSSLPVAASGWSSEEVEEDEGEGTSLTSPQAGEGADVAPADLAPPYAVNETLVLESVMVLRDEKDVSTSVARAKTPCSSIPEEALEDLQVVTDEVLENDPFFNSGKSFQ